MNLRTTRMMAAIVPLVLLLGACGGKKPTAVQNDEGEPSAKAALASTVKMGDPGAASQLLKGFWSVENNTWRWTAGSFSVQLKTPAGAAQKGGALSLSLVIPEISMTKLKSQTLVASINGKELQPKTYSAAGNYTYAVDVPGNLLSGAVTTVDFVLDNSMPPAAGDRRELGVIAYSVSLDNK